MKKQHAPKNTSRRNGGKKINIIAIELAACIVLTAVLVGTVIGKYRQQFNSYGSVRALDFYFTSDFLDGGNHPIAPGTTNFSFTLGNHADDLRFSEMDITYTVTVERTPADSPADPSAGVPTIKINGTEVSSETMDKDGKRDHTVEISNLVPGNYTITATATGKKSGAADTVSGYKKILTATIEIPADAPKLYQHTYKDADYILLTIWNEGDEAGTVTIEYTGIPDNTNPDMTTWARSSGTEVTTGVITIAPYSSKVFRFFNDNGNIASAAAKSDGMAVATGTPK